MTSVLWGFCDLEVNAYTAVKLNVSYSLVSAELQNANISDYGFFFPLHSL